MENKLYVLILLRLDGAISILNVEGTYEQVREAVENLSTSDPDIVKVVVGEVVSVYVKDAEEPAK